MKKSVTLALLLSGMLAAGGIVHAQAEGPKGETGSPGRSQANTSMGAKAPLPMENSRADVKADARAANKTDMTSKGETGSPGKGVGAGQKGEVAGGGMKSRDDLRAEREMKAATRKADRSAAVSARTAKEGPKGEAGTPGLTQRESATGNKQKP